MEGKLQNSYVREALLTYLHEYGVTQKHIAKKVGLSETTISIFLKGDRVLTPEKLERIQEIINKK